MSRSLAYFVTLLSFILFGLVIATKYFGVDVPVVSGILNGSLFETTIIAYVLLLLPAIFR